MVDICRATDYSATIISTDSLRKSRNHYDSCGRALRSPDGYGMLAPMRAVLIPHPGGPEVLRLSDVPDPEFGPEEVRVRVGATALNRADLLQRRGRYPAPRGAPPDIPGLEFAGEVEARGRRAHRWQVGDRVMGILGGGGYAERVVLHEGLCMQVPPAMRWEEAAAIPEAFLTAFDALYELGHLAGGETLLVHAAASGVGTAAVQLALAGGCHVIGFSRSADKRERLLRLGVHQVLDPTVADVAEAVREASTGHGIDLVLDMVGAGVVDLNQEVLREQGRIVLIGLLGGARAEFDLTRFIGKRLTLTGSVLRPRPLEQKLELVRRFAPRVLPLFDSGSVRPVIDRSYSWTDVAEAHARMERNANFGKIVLRID